MLLADKDILDKSQRLDRALSRSPGSSMHGALNFMDHLNRSRRAGQASARQQQDQSTSFDLTGRTGSYMYMAPEVLMGQPYNEKVGSPLRDHRVMLYKLRMWRLSSLPVPMLLLLLLLHAQGPYFRAPTVALLARRWTCSPLGRCCMN